MDSGSILIRWLLSKGIELPTAEEILNANCGKLSSVMVVRGLMKGMDLALKDDPPCVIMDGHEDRSLLNLDPSVRLYNCLTKCGIHWVSQLYTYSIKDLAQIRNMGKETIIELKRTLRANEYPPLREK